MKRSFYTLLVFTLVILGSFIALAQETPPLPPTDGNVDFLQFLIQSLGGFKGASSLAIAGLVVQILIKFLNTPWVGEIFKKVSGSIKLLIITGLTLVSGILILMLPPNNLNLAAALTHSMTLTSFMVFVNQIYQHLTEKKT